VARRPKIRVLDQLLHDVESKLRTFHVEYAGLSLRAKVLQLVQVNHSLADLGVSVADDSGLRGHGAQDRIKSYFLEFVGESISGDELAVVGGISEYGRRIRELRKEQGYRIFSGASPDPETDVRLRPDHYLLSSSTPDEGAARRWHVANRIRKSAAGSQAKLLAYLLENVGDVVTTEELAYVAKDATSYGRRVRELRTEEGYAVATRFTGRPDLGVGEYILLSKDRVAEPHDRHISHDNQRVVYDRDGNKCRLCQWSQDKWSEADPRILELHHLVEHHRRGENEPGNLIVVCNVCHDEIHAGRAAPPDS